MGWVFAFLFFCLWLWAIRNRVPALILALYRQAAKARCTYPPMHRGGRPRISRDLIALIHLMALKNRWRAKRIHEELLLLGFDISRATVSNYIRGIAYGAGGTPEWKTFLANHADFIVAIDMAVILTATMQRLYLLLVLDHGTRKILHFEVTAHPTSAWLAQQMVEAFPWDTSPRYLIRDNDKAYGQVFRRRLKGMGIKDRPIRPYSPWQNGYVERLIGTVRRECLDHIVPLNASHLRRVMGKYVHYYNVHRPHLGLGGNSPESRSVEAIGAIKSTPILGGLHHRYYREAPE